jgi:hypothetical protein
VATIATSCRADLSASEIAAFSQTALDRDLTADAELLVAAPRDEAVVLGAFQRKSEVTIDLPLVRRGSGGAAARVSPGGVWVALALRRVAALEPSCNVDNILNRHVRPLLRAIGAAHYFGRDWIAVAHRPVALVAFGYSQRTGHALFEALVGVTTPFALAPRASFRGKEPTTVGRLELEAIAGAYVAGHERRLLTNDVLATGDARAAAIPIDDDPPWTATRDEPIGLLGAGRDGKGRMRVGGEIMAGREGIADLESRLAEGLDPRRALNLLGSPGAVPFGFSMAALHDVLIEALAREP